MEKIMERVSLSSPGGYNQYNQVDPVVKRALEEGVKINLESGVYEGQVKDGVPHGFGALTYNENYKASKYVGEFVDGWPHGIGHYDYRDGCTYDGQVVKGDSHGKGVMYYPKGINGSTNEWKYEGSWVNNWPTGIGITTSENHPTIKRYEGEHVRGNAHGQGKTFFQDGRIYEGEYKDNQLCGRGIMNFPDGKIYDGMWANNNFAGKGKLISPNGTFTGEFVDGKAFEGTWISHDHTRTYKGTYDKNGEILDGTMTFYDGGFIHYRGGKERCCTIL